MFFFWLLFLLFVHSFVEDSQDKRDHMGIYFSLGSLFCVILLESFATSFQEADFHWKNLLGRFIIGFIGEFGIIGSLLMLERTDAIVFLGGVLLNVWIIVLSPRLFVAIGLVSQTPPLKRHKGNKNNILTIFTIHLLENNALYHGSFTTISTMKQHSLEREPL